jgi:hypothetical protein
LELQVVVIDSVSNPLWNRFVENDAESAAAGASRIPKFPLDFDLGFTEADAARERSAKLGVAVVSL